MHRSTFSLVGLFGFATASVASAATFSFNGDNGGFVSTFLSAPFDGPWVYGATAGAEGGGWSTEGQGPEIGHPTTTALTSPSLSVTSTGIVELSFGQKYSFESDPTNWDGGSIFLSVNGGAFSILPAGSFTLQGYNGTIEPTSGSELAGQPGFVATSPGYSRGIFGSCIATLGSFTAGNTLQVQFRAAGDTNTSGGSPDWAIDNVSITNTTVVPEPSSVAFLLLGAIGMVARRKRQANC
jgi:hypothetical protein